MSYTLLFLILAAGSMFLAGAQVIRFYTTLLLLIKDRELVRAGTKEKVPYEFIKGLY